MICTHSILIGWSDREQWGRRGI